MGLKCLGVCVVVLSALINHREEGFGLDNIIRAFEGLALKTATMEIQEPADALVSLTLEVLDADNDGRVAITEVREFLIRFLMSAGQNYHHPAFKGYLITLATIVDSDGSGFIEQREYQKAASVLIEEATDIVVGPIIEIAVRVQVTIEGLDTVADSNNPMVIHVLDRNGNGEISNEEMGLVFSLRRFERMSFDFQSVANHIDSNNDNKLNEAEAQQWLDEVFNETPYGYRQLLTYAKITSLAGRDIADTWARI